MNPRPRAILVPLGAILASFLALSCDQRRPEEGPSSLPSLAGDGIEALAGAEVFFGHQSVGYNLVDGAREVLGGQATGDGYAVVETREAAVIAGAGLYHCAIGANGDPMGKMADFEALLRSGFARRVDLALMKLCYVDIVGDTDIEAVFAAYEGTMGRLAADYPDVTFAWTTVPLTTVETGPKALAKRLLGRPPRGEADNLARERYNRLIRDGLPAGTPLIDLALFESVSPKGVQMASRSGDDRYHALLDEYTSDGGHLDVDGRRIVASRFLAALSEALRGRQ